MDKNNVFWLVHDGILRYDSQKLPDIVKAQGFNLQQFEWAPGDPDIRVDLGAQNCVIMYGTKQFVDMINKSGPFQPGGLGNNSRTSATEYMSNLPLEWLLNRKGIFTTWCQFKERKDDWWQIFPGEKLFVRPNSGMKTFAGQTVSLEDWDEDIRTIDQLTSVMPETLMMVAPINDLQGEFRFVVAEGEIIAGSEYRWDNKLDIRRDWPEECFELAQRVAQHPWQVDIAYTCDVALTDDGPKVVELNGFCSAGLYACDMNKVVEGISRVAWREWSGENI